MRSNLKSRLKVSVISLILILLLTEASPAHRNESYSHDGGRQTCQPCWMKYLKDDVHLSQLSIPGTHDTMSFYGGPAVQTQSMALHFQLESGIRVLDIRCARNDKTGGFDIHHGPVFQNATFEDVLNRVVDFLEKNPHETVLMRVKEEYTNNPWAFEQIFRRRYWNNEKYKDRMFYGNPTIPDITQNPTLGEMRGKIVILQDFAREQCDPPSYKPEFGLCYKSFSIQDEFKLEDNDDLYPKWEKVNDHLNAANSGPADTKYMNYLSGSGGSFPYFVVSGHSDQRTRAPRLATGRTKPDYPDTFWKDFPRLACVAGICTIAFEGTNTLVFGALRDGGEYKNRVGIIMTDFPGWGLINRIIDLNKPFRKPNQPLECGEDSPRTCRRPALRKRR